MSDLFSNLFGTRDVPATDRRRAARRQCDNEGHRYQVVGKMSPTKVMCARCGCSWAIGPKTEPAS